MILLTGFLGSFLIPRILDLTPKETQIVCLVQDKFLALAKDKIIQNPGWKDRVQVIVGDITKSNLGLPKEWNERVTHIYHLAAIYDLSVKKELAHKINVQGTIHILDFAKACSKLQRFDYVSTCYVSGRFPGHFFEADLVKEQKFNNYYEETKYEAEIEVQRAMKNGLPATIYRPGIVVGDSINGHTQKFDGPYYIIQWLDRQKPMGILPELGDYKRLLVNLVPVDFVANAIASLSVHSLSVGKVYQLADPNPPTIDIFLKQLQVILDKKIITLPFSPKLTKLSLRYLKPLREWMKINPDTIDYFTHPTIYDTTNANMDLNYLGIKCPSLNSYLPVLVKYMKETDERPTEAMV
jgi:thioester reductase-like protein